MKLNQKGQSALEYLMTYGWALVVIVVVVAALVLLVGSPSTQDVCQTPGTGFSVTNQNLADGVLADGDTAWTIQVSNITGRTMTFVAGTPDDLAFVAAGNALAGEAAADFRLNGAAIAAQSLNTGQAATVTILAPAAITAGSRVTTTATLAYTDPDGIQRTIPINCTGSN